MILRQLIDLMNYTLVSIQATGKCADMRYTAISGVLTHIMGLLNCPFTARQSKLRSLQTIRYSGAHTKALRCPWSKKPGMTDMIESALRKT